jgi:iron complex outermembrane recepter protein
MSRLGIHGVPTRVALGVSLALGSVVASAQTQPTPAAAPATTNSDQLQEVVVTAQFRNESVQQTPLAITAINSQMLEQRGQTSLAQITADVPSVNLTPSTTAFGPSMSAFIRGVGQYDLDPALEPGVGIYVDDVYFATLTGSLLDLLDLDRVEVLRGPQGTLEGMNSEGGAVKLFSKQPNSTPSTTFDALYGSRNHVELRASTNFALSDNVFVRIAGVGNHQDGYENVFDFGCANPSFTATATDGVTGAYSVAPEFNTHAGSCLTGHEGGTSYAGGRASLRWVVNDRVDVTVSGDLTNENQEAPAETLIYAGLAPKNGVAQSPGIDNITIPTTSGALLPYDSSKVPAMIPSNIYSTYANFCMPAITNPSAIPGLGSNFNEPAYCVSNNQQLNSWGVSGVANWAINDTTSLKNIVADRGYSSSWGEDNDASPWPVGLGADALEHHQFSEELRLNGTWTELLDYTVGAFYFRELSTYASHQDLWYATDNIIPGVPLNGYLNFIQDDPVLAHDKAGYIHTVWHLVPKLDVTLGLRYTSQDKTYNYVRVNPQGTTGGSASLVGGLNGYSGYYSADRFDYRGNVDYHFTDQVMAYGQVSTGFKGGGVNPRPFYVEQAIHFNPETLTNYELGLKSSWLDNRIRVNLDAYFSQYRDIQLALLNCGFIPSIGAAFGAPCALPYNAGSAHEKGVELETSARFGGFQFDLSGSYIDFKYVYLNPNSGVTSGMVTPFTPEWQGNAGAQYTLNLPPGSLTGRLDMSSRSQVYTNAVNDMYNRIGGYTTYNAHLVWDPPQGNWQIALQALNLTGKRYWLNVFDLAAAGGGSVTGNPAPPMEIDLEVKHTL